MAFCGVLVISLVIVNIWLVAVGVFSVMVYPFIVLIIPVLVIMPLQLPSYGKARSFLINCIRYERCNKKRVLPKDFKPNRLWHVLRDRPEVTEIQWRYMRKTLELLRNTPVFNESQVARDFQAIHEWELDTGERIIPPDIQYSPFLQRM